MSFLSNFIEDLGRVASGVGANITGLFQGIGQAIDTAGRAGAEAIGDTLSSDTLLLGQPFGGVKRRTDREAGKRKTKAQEDAKIKAEQDRARRISEQASLLISREAEARRGFLGSGRSLLSLSGASNLLTGR